METTSFTTKADPAQILRLALDGQGVADDGRRLPFALPGETVAATGDGRRILNPSPDRVPPPCRHFGTCGGCALQHASDTFVAAWKVSVVERALAARGLAAADMRPVVTSPPNSRRRAVFAGRRTKSGAIVGFHAARSTEVIALEECHVLRPELLSARPALAGLTRLGASRSKAIRLTATLAETGLDVAVDGGKPLDAALRLGLAEAADAHDLARLAWDGEAVAARRQPWQTMGRARVVPPPGGFLQATAEGAAALTAAVREAVGEATRVVDLFAGAGTFALPLAETAEVYAVEADAALLAALDAGWRAARGLRRITTEARDLYRRPLLAAEIARHDAVVIDPPRAGAEAQARAIAASTIPVVAAVSCNPVSFARDAAILAAAGFRLDWVQVVDQFRWSPHIELAARLSRS